MVASFTFPSERALVALEPHLDALWAVERARRSPDADRRVLQLDCDGAVRNEWAVPDRSAGYPQLIAEQGSVLLLQPGNLDEAPLPMELGVFDPDGTVRRELAPLEGGAPAKRLLDLDRLDGTLWLTTTDEVSVHLQTLDLAAGRLEVQRTIALPEGHDRPEVADPEGLTLADVVSRVSRIEEAASTLRCRSRT